MREVALTDQKGASSPAHPQIEVLATFIADPVLEILQYWCHEFGYESKFLPTSYGQLFPRLHEQTERFQAGDIHVVLFAVRDLIPEKDRSNLAQEAHANVVEFVKALTSGTAARGGTWIIVRCLDPTANESEAILEAFEQQAAYISIQTTILPGTLYLETSDLSERYGIDSCFDNLTDEHAHIPYTDAYYTAIGTSVFRAIRSRFGQVYKLIVTDCDGTLWDGICGEMAPHELTIRPHYQWLHELLQKKKSAGMLLGICSQNNAKDVQEVFAQREDLGLALTDFTGKKINWKDKADNIQDLAQELNIALESVIFLDNDPVQRNKVRTTLPQVLVPELPAEPTKWPSYLEHLWAFDTYWVTEEANRRTLLYRDHAARENIRSSSSNLAQFLKELDLQISIEPATGNDIPRLFELLNRVTQFNTNGIRIKESDIAKLITSEHGEWLAVRVKDRFGDYGLVGAMSCKYETEFCTIGSFLLSCRALGRGVENQMLQTLGKLTLSKQMSQIRFTVAKTSRNLPAIEFLISLGLSESNLETGKFQLDTASAASPPNDNNSLLKLKSAVTSAPGTEEPPKAKVPETSHPADEAERILAATNSVRDISSLSRHARLFRKRTHEVVHKPAVAPQSEIEKRMMGLFQDLLGHDHIGFDEEFFDVGGHSLLAMRLLSRIRDTFDVDLPIRLLFMQRLTITNLANIVAAGSTPEENTAQLDTIKNALDSFSDNEIAELFGDLGTSDRNEG